MQGGSGEVGVAKEGQGLVRWVQGGKDREWVTYCSTIYKENIHIAGEGPLIET